MKTETSRVLVRALAMVLATAVAAVAWAPATVAVTNVTVSGVLLDAQGNPMSGAIVGLYGTPTSDSTDTSGAFAMTMQSGQSVRLSIDPGPYDLATGASRPQAGTIRLQSSSFTPIANHDLGELTMPPMGPTRTLKVVDTNGTPVYGAWVGEVALRDGWLDTAHELGGGLTVQSDLLSGPRFQVNRPTSEDGTVVFTAPRMAGEAMPVLPISIYGPTGQFLASSADAIGTDPPTATISNYEVGPPTAPTNVWAWAAMNSGSDFYGRVYWSPSSSNGTPVTGYTVTAHPGNIRTSVGPESVGSATVPGLTPGVSYTFTVTADSAAGGTSSAPTPPVLAAGTPGRPKNVVTTPGDRRLTVSWEPADANGSPITAYEVRLDQNAPVTLTADQTSITFNDLVNGQRYDVDITAVNAVGPGFMSAWAGGYAGNPSPDPDLEPVPVPTPLVVTPPSMTTPPAPVVGATALLQVATQPQVKGRHLAGKVLRAKAGATTPAASRAGLQWLRNGKAIKRATKASYKLTAKDRGKTISLRIIWVRDGYPDLILTTKRVRVRAR